MSCNNQKTASTASAKAPSTASVASGSSRLIASSGVDVPAAASTSVATASQHASQHASQKAASQAQSIKEAAPAEQTQTIYAVTGSAAASQRAASRTQSSVSQKAASKAPTVAASAASQAAAPALSAAGSQKAASKAPTAASQAAAPALSAAGSQKAASKAPTAAPSVAPTKQASQAGLTSELETALLNAQNPLSSNETEEITVNGETGVFLNKAEVANFKGTVALDKYPINQDACPQIIKKKAQNVELVQELSVKFLKPKLQAPGPITIRQEPNKNVEPAPPVIIRQQPKAPQDGGNKVFREVPPCLPKAPGPKCITIPGKLNPPPPRKVIIEKLAGFPPKPDSISVERWVEPDPVKRQVKFIPAPPAPCVPKPRNIIVEWEAGQVSIKEELKNLGVSDADPNEYRQQHKDLVQASQLPEFAQKAEAPNGSKLAANSESLKNVFYELEGDVQSLSLVDLDKEGLAEYKDYLQKLGVSHRPASASDFDSKVQYCPDNCNKAPTPAPTPKLSNCPPELPPKPACN